VRNKIDLDALSWPAKVLGIDAANPGRNRGGLDFAVSAVRGDGLAELIAALVAFAQDCFGANESGLIARERQRNLLRETAAALLRSMEGGGRRGEELAAEDLRAAAHSLGRLLGRVDVEDVLDKIFREFCVGK
jgi:tRNA modification GTPase